MKQFKQDLGIGTDAGGNPLLTTVWGYGGNVVDPGNPGKTIGFWNYPAATFEAKRGRPVKVRWTNDLRSFDGIDAASSVYDSYPYLTEHPLTVDTSIHGAETKAVKTVVHLHGGEVGPESDGYPEDTFLPGGNPGYDYTYPNLQKGATLWYHDHGLGITRLNVHMGLAGFYLLREPAEAALKLPSAEYEVPIVVQDRSFYPNGEFFRSAEGSGGREFWEPEFFGNTIMVNGKAWPYMDVEPRKYRFRFLNGSDSRFYSMKLVVQEPGEATEELSDLEDNPDGPEIVQIGTDGGLLEKPVETADRLTTGPGERHDIVIDFSQFKGKNLILVNNAPAPFKGVGVIKEGQELADINTGQVMMFKVGPSTKNPDQSRTAMPANTSLPPTLNQIPVLTPQTTRTMTLNEAMVNDEPNAAFVNLSRFMNPDAMETPTVGATEVWEVINTTEDVHPIHMHLVQFQVLNRQKINDTEAFLGEYNTMNETKFGSEVWTMAMQEGLMQGRPDIPDLAPYLNGEATVTANERGWKDTVHMNPGEVTRILVRFAPQDGGSFSFDVNGPNCARW
ncbi:MAG: multicopper oxidase family protein [Candidatus Aquicultor sp.]